MECVYKLRSRDMLGLHDNYTKLRKYLSMSSAVSKGHAYIVIQNAAMKSHTQTHTHTQQGELLNRLLFLQNAKKKECNGHVYRLNKRVRLRLLDE
jgi:hypothetical protein